MHFGIRLRPGTFVLPALAVLAIGNAQAALHDYVVAPQGGDITGAQLSAMLQQGNVTLISSGGKQEGSGNVLIDDTVSWTANTTLTLTASNNLRISSDLAATGNQAGLVLNPDTANGGEDASGTGRYRLDMGHAVSLSGTASVLTVSGTTYVVVNSLGAAADAINPPATPTLQGMAAPTNLTTSFALGSNIDASVTQTWNQGAGFTPIGSGQAGYQNAVPFTGNFDGLGHVVTNLYINQPNTLFVGLFGYHNNALQNVGLASGSVNGQGLVGMLAGCGQGPVKNSFATGAVSGSQGQIGGLVGCNANTVSDSYATGNVSGNYWVGGLVGADLNVTNSYATGNVSASYKAGGGLVGMHQGALTNSHANGTVSGGKELGGLVGINASTTLNTSYATGNVSGGQMVGGLIGASISPVDSSYATGNVSGGDHTGGLIGDNATGPSSGNATVSNSYSTGNVTSSGCYVGGLIGFNRSQGSQVSNSYTASAVRSTNTGSGCVGAFLGMNASSAVINGYWNQTANPSLQGVGTGTPAGMTGTTGLSVAQMRTTASFVGFTFTSTPGLPGNAWVLVDGNGSVNNASGTAGATYPMLASEYSTQISDAHQLQLVTLAPNSNYQVTADIDLMATNGGHDVWGGGSLVMLGQPSAPFTGTFDGLEHRIRYFTHADSSIVTDVGLFAQTQPTTVIKNVMLITGSFINVPNGQDIGALVGSNSGLISHSCVNATVVGSHSVGALVGVNIGTIEDSCSLGGVKGNVYVGGLAGHNRGVIRRSYSTVNTLTLSQDGGGLVGQNFGTISNSYATGSVSSKYGANTGGLVATNAGGPGGGGVITDSYALGVVQGGSKGGLVQLNNGGSVTGSFWNTTTSKLSTSAGGTGMNTANMQTPANFTSATPANGNVNPAWDFSQVWMMPSGGYPQLRQVSPIP